MEIKSVANSFPLLSLQITPPLTDPIIPSPPQPFVHAVLMLKGVLKNLIDSSNTTAEIHPSDENFLEEDSNLIDFRDLSFSNPGTFHFGLFLNDIDRLKHEGRLLPMVRERRQEINEQKKHWSSIIEELKKDTHQNFYPALEHTLREGNLIPNPLGCGSSYFIIDREAVPRFVVKPVDEDIFCINNRKELGSLFNDVDHRVRDDIPLYRSAQTDAFCWEIATLCGLEETTPKAMMGIIKEDQFYDFTQWIDEEDKASFISQTGPPDKEKLCSIQEFISDSQDLVELLHEFYKKELSDEEIASHFDQKDFEEVCMFIWLSYDNDAHGGNFRTFVKRVDESGKKIYGIKKIDNGLSFPEKNTKYVNILAWAPNALFPISAELKQKIAQLPMEQILKRMDHYELSTSKEAFIERVEILKELSKREGITIAEIDVRFSFLSRKIGKQIALSTMSTQEILDLLIEDPLATSMSIIETEPVYNSSKIKNSYERA